MFELNEQGLQEFLKDPIAYIKKVRDLCWVNNVGACFEETPDYCRLSLINDKTNQGCVIEKTKLHNRRPFILDNDEPFSQTRDCPTVEEAFLRFWNMNKLLMQGKPYLRNDIMDAQLLLKDVQMGKITFDPNDAIRQRDMNWWKETHDSAGIINAITKSTTVYAIETFNDCYDEKEIASVLPEFLKRCWRNGHTNAYDNLDLIKSFCKALKKR